MAIIYKITNKQNGKVYIGQTRRSLEWRLTNSWCGHFTAAKQGYNGLLSKALRKYGKNGFTYEVIEERPNNTFKTKQELIDWLNTKEIYWIEQYDSFKHGYNRTRGGQYKPELTNKAKEALSLAIRATYATGEPQKKISSSVKLAHKAHPEIIEKIRARSSGSTWMYKIEKNVELRHFAAPEQVDNYLKQGFIIGMPPSMKETTGKAQLGKPRTAEERAKISKTLTGKKKTKVHAKHISEGLRGRQLSEQAKKNVALGTKTAMAALSEEKKQEMRNNLSLAFKGRRRVTNGQINRYVKGEELETLLKAGWQYGTKETFNENKTNKKS